MQFFNHSLLRASHEKGIEDNGFDEVEEPRKSIIVLRQCSKKGTDRRKFGCKKYLKLFLICRKGKEAACLYKSTSLKRSSRDDIKSRSKKYYHSMKMKEEDIVASNVVVEQGSSHAGNKVLPISEATTTTLSTSKTSTSEQVSEKKEKVKGDKAKTMSRMKELLRWAVAAKSEKGGKFIGRKVLMFRNRTNCPKAEVDDARFSYESPKISLRWDVESCSTTTSSVYSATSSRKKADPNMLSLCSSSNNNIQDSSHWATRKGNWITSDSEFVVLEL